MNYMDRPTTLGELMDSIEGCPWVYCGDTLIASPADDLIELITPVAYNIYLHELGLSKIKVESYEERQSLTGDYILNVYLDSIMDGYLVSTEQIAEKAENLAFRYDLTRQQAVVVTLIDFAKLPKSAAANLLGIRPQSVNTAYNAAKPKINAAENKKNEN